MRRQRSWSPFRTAACLLLAVMAAGCGPLQNENTPTTTSTPLPAPASTPAPTFVPATSTTASQPHRPLLMAHYMPWYQTQAVSGAWGWHWTMNHFDPSKTDASGQTMIASHYHPLTGPYDTSDDALLEYQVLLMKLSGIDGVIVDWYGIEDFWDYGAIHEATRKLFQYVKKAGLRFAICYEDVTIKNMIDNGHLNARDAYPHGQKVMRYLQDHWFSDDAYLKTPSGRPVLLVFGNPPYFKASSDWENLFSGLQPVPLLVTEDNPLPPAAPSSYPWPPMSLSQNGTLTQNTLSQYLTTFYQKAAAQDYRVASAFPGFNDIYKEAGVSAGYGKLDAQNGQIFRFTLRAAIQSNPDVIQLVTWNDYGEGTGIEPTTEFGNLYLGIVQDTRRGSIDPAFRYTTGDLALPLQIYKLRQQHQGDAKVNAQLDQAFEAIVQGRLDAAAALISK